MKRKIITISIVCCFLITALFSMSAIGMKSKTTNYHLLKNIDLKTQTSNDNLDQELDRDNTYWATDFATNEIEYGDRWLAQSFKPTLNTLTRVQLKMFKEYDDQRGFIKVSIRKDINGLDLRSCKIHITNIPRSMLGMDEWIEFSFLPLKVKPEDTYYIVCRYEKEISKYEDYGDDIGWVGDVGYDRGEALVSNNNNVDWDSYTSGWENVDFCFRTYGLNRDRVTSKTVHSIFQRISELFSNNFPILSRLLKY